MSTELQTNLKFWHGLTFHVGQDSMDALGSSHQVPLRGRRPLLNSLSLCSSREGPVGGNRSSKVALLASHLGLKITVIGRRSKSFGPVLPRLSAGFRAAA